MENIFEIIGDNYSGSCDLLPSLSKILEESSHSRNLTIPVSMGDPRESLG